MSRRLLQRRGLRHAAGALGLGLGAVLTLGTLVLMNRSSMGHLDGSSEEVVMLGEVSRKKPPPRSRPKPKPQKKKTRQSPPPTPSLAASLGGLGFGLPGLGDSLFSDSSDNLMAQGDVVMTEDSVDERPRPASQAPCAFPRQALNRGQTGSVSLSFLVMPDGSVQAPKVLEADPTGVFEASALQCVGAWRYHPAIYQGEPVKLRVRQTLHFELD